MTWLRTDSSPKKSLGVLLTEASSTSARQALYALGRLGYRVDIVNPQPFCLGRFSRYVRAWYRCPPFAAEPAAYMRTLLSRLRSGRYDVLIPVHDQVYLLARFRDELERYVAVALPPLAALEQVQSKATFLKLLDALSLPYPATTVVQSTEELRRPWSFPCYVKLAYGTAGTGVWYIRDQADMDRLISELKAGEPQHEDILVQQPAQGVFRVTQAVFQRGRLIAAHSYQARALGVGGSARCRESIAQPVVEQRLRDLGSALGWHGALHIEYFYDETSGQSTYIDANPRIGETLNATLSGTNLCDLLAQVSLGRALEPAPPSRIGVRTHSLLNSLLAAAEQGHGRRALLRHVWEAWSKRGLYQASQDELSRLVEDWLSTIPLAVVLLRLFAAPGLAPRIIREAVHNYGLTAAGAAKIRELCLINQGRVLS
jgi:predicted ATP-grasp superfamily ATP-dependent carboligase